MRNKYNGGEWTQARFNAFVKSSLRGASRRWPPKYQCLNEAFVRKDINPKSGRLAKLYKCNLCTGLFAAADVQVDHIDPIIPATGFTTWDDVINRMFCEADNLQVVCVTCHKSKTAEERLLTKQLKEKNV